MLTKQCPCGQTFTGHNCRRYCCRKCKDAAHKATKLPAERQAVDKSRSGVRFKGGVLRRHSNGCDYWAAMMQLTRPRGSHRKLSKIIRYKQFSVRRLGDKGARLAATFTRLTWLIELELWRPSEGNPFGLLEYTELLKDSSPDSVVDDQSSPWVREMEYETQR